MHLKQMLTTADILKHLKGKVEVWNISDNCEHVFLGEGEDIYHTFQVTEEFQIVLGTPDQTYIRYFLVMGGVGESDEGITKGLVRSVPVTLLGNVIMFDAEHW